MKLVPMAVGFLMVVLVAFALYVRSIPPKVVVQPQTPRDNPNIVMEAPPGVELDGDMQAAIQEAVRKQQEEQQQQEEEAATDQEQDEPPKPDAEPDTIEL